MNNKILKKIDKGINIIMALVFIGIMYILGSIIFSYKLPNFLVHHKTPQEIEREIDNSKIQIQMKDLKILIRERDSLKKELTKSKKQ